MTAAVLVSPRIESRSGSTVASFRDLHGAALAVHRLVERGFSLDEVFIRERRRRRSARLVRVDHFDVVATKRPEAAAHQLASWWDSDAIPVSSARVDASQ